MDSRQAVVDGRRRVLVGHGGGHEGGVGSGGALGEGPGRRGDGEGQLGSEIRGGLLGLREVEDEVGLEVVYGVGFDAGRE